MGIDERVRHYYEVSDEAGRLWDSPRGTLTRLRTWELLDRFVPAGARVADIGGGPGTHAVHLVETGHDVVLVDPVPHHVAAAANAAGRRAGFGALRGDGRNLPFADASFDVVLVMGPLYHLFERAERVAVLREARRILRPGGRVVAEVISRHVWIIDASLKGLLGDAEVWESFDVNLRSGWSNTPDRVVDGVFWGYFHAAGELDAELADAGLDHEATVAVEGYAWTLGNLGELLAEPAALLRAIALTETEPSMLGVSAHTLGVARRPH